jgi:hypothetical protein
MIATIEFIKRLENLEEGERSRLRRLAGQPLDKTLQGFDLFTGLWWPLRQKSRAAPRREVAWLIAKLYGASRVPHVRPESGLGPSFPTVLGKCEPRNDRDQHRFRTRFDGVICSTLFNIESPLHGGLREIAKAVAGRVAHARSLTGIDWVLLLDDLSLWDRVFNLDDTWQKSRLNTHERVVHCRETHRTPQDLWACEYLNATVQLQGANHAD